jgi:hypothetical protein
VTVCGLRCGLIPPEPKGGAPWPRITGGRRENGRPPERDAASSSRPVWRHGLLRTSPFGGIEIVEIDGAGTSGRRGRLPYLVVPPSVRQTMSAPQRRPNADLGPTRAHEIQLPCPNRPEDAGKCRGFAVPAAWMSLGQDATTSLCAIQRCISDRRPPRACHMPLHICQRICSASHSRTAMMLSTCISTPLGADQHVRW